MIQNQEQEAYSADDGSLPLQDENGAFGAVKKPQVNTTGGISLASPMYSPVLKAPAGDPIQQTQAPGYAPYAGGMVNSVSAPPSGPVGDPQVTPPNFSPPGMTNPPGTQAISGAESRYAINPTTNPATSGLMARLQAEATRQLDQPTVYDDALFGQIKAASARGINEDYDTAQGKLDSELASRGINYSTIAGGRILDLNSRRANALSDLDTSLLRERANALAAGRSSSFNNARGIFGDSDSSARADRNEQRTERGYTDSVRNDARDQAMQGALYDEQFGRQNDSDWSSLLGNVFGYGSNSGNSGVGALDRAGDTYGTAADRAGRAAGEADAGLGDISEYLARFLGAGR